MARAPAEARRRVRVRVEGTVQGVGFRPYVHRLAGEIGLAGWVLNDERGVLAEVEGDPRGWSRSSSASAPRPRRSPRSSGQHRGVRARRERRLSRSRPAKGGGGPDAPVAPDTATCEDCLAELPDPADRRYRYPFINCTNCGPRFTIVRGVPYDRPLTTMAGFEMCERCRAEYEDPARPPLPRPAERVPGLRAAGAAARPRRPESSGERADAVAAAARELLAGRIVAVKGLGGYHLCCRADDEDAVAALRSRKHREDKPFALMAADLDAARELVELDPAEEELLQGRERPIVVARRAAGGREVAPSVAPGKPDLGVMLPYSPLHHLLAADAGVPLVMTSGNVSDEPIAFHDADALERLAPIADLFLVHDRPIEIRTDDSVVRSSAAGTLMLRRSRGYVPAALRTGRGPPLLACGAEQKSTFCLAKGAPGVGRPPHRRPRELRDAHLVLHGVDHFQRLFAVEPASWPTTCTPSTSRRSTRSSATGRGVEHVAVQHHHAHLAAVLAEHGETGPAIGAIFDGTGYGPDGTIWGGELLAGGLAGFERAGMLWPARLPGGAAAIREPWRMACAWLAVATGEPEPPRPAALAQTVDPGAWDQVCQLVKTGVASPPTTSMGRLFDALAAICGLRPRVTYEGQAAVELEAAADLAERGAYPVTLLDTDGVLLIDVREMVGAVRDDAAARVPVETISARVHNALADAAARALSAEAERRGVGIAVLAGGVFQNRLLTERTLAALEPGGLRALNPRALPPNDGAISFGQAAIAAANARLGHRPPPRRRGPTGADALAGHEAPPAEDLHGVRPHRPGVRADRPVVLPDGGLELAAVVLAGVARAAVEPTAVPDEPARRRGVEVGAEEKLLELGLERAAGLAVGLEPRRTRT